MRALITSGAMSTRVRTCASSRRLIVTCTTSKDVRLLAEVDARHGDRSRSVPVVDVEVRVQLLPACVSMTMDQVRC